MFFRSARILFLLIFALTACVYHDIGVDDDDPSEEPFICLPDEVTWSEDIQPLMISSCVKSNCHDGISRNDFSDYDVVKEYSDDIKSQTRNRSMPFDGPALTQLQIDMIACWVDSGSLDN